MPSKSTFGSSRRFGGVAWRGVAHAVARCRYHAHLRGQAGNYRSNGNKPEDGGDSGFETW
jgi:hypothetical protein